MATNIKHASNRPVPKWHFWTVILVVSAVGMAVWALAYWISYGDDSPHALLTAFGKAGLTLAFGAVAGGFVAHLFRRWDKHRADLAAEQAFYRAILDDLKSVHDRVERARLLIDAHQSAKTYGEQMRILPDADITLHNIRRALRPGYADVLEDIEKPLKACSAFIKGLTGEFRIHYKKISNAQLRDEAINEHRCEQLAKGDIEKEAVKFAREGWEMIAKLEALKVLRDEAEWDKYYIAFRWHIDLASFHLRKRLDGGDKSDRDGQLADLKKDRRDAKQRIATALKEKAAKAAQP